MANTALCAVRRDRQREVSALAIQRRGSQRQHVNWHPDFYRACHRVLKAREGPNGRELCRLSELFERDSVVAGATTTLGQRVYATARAPAIVRSATRSVAPCVPPSSRRDSCARRKNSGASCSHVAPIPP